MTSEERQRQRQPADQPRRPRRLTAGRCVTFGVLSVIMAGCAPLLTGTSNVDDALKVLEWQNARGCLYVRGNARPYADVTALVVGTWGPDPPAYAECWQGLPPGVP